MERGKGDMMYSVIRQPDAYCVSRQESPLGAVVSALVLERCAGPIEVVRKDGVREIAEKIGGWTGEKGSRYGLCGALYRAVTLGSCDIETADGRCYAVREEL